MQSFQDSHASIYPDTIWRGERMNIDECARQDMKDRLPELIAEEGLFKDAREEFRFSIQKGGAFRCPVCGCKLVLYRNRSSSDNPWGINGFGRCSHFGRGGQYHGDTVGLYAAIHGISEGEAFIQLVKGRSASEPHDSRWLAERRRNEEVEAEKSTARTEDNAAYAMSHASWGDSMPPIGKRLLKQRGIELDDIPSAIRESVGYISASGFTNMEGRRYHIEGIVFRLGDGELSVQIRRTKKDAFVGKGEKGPRFISYGEARCFLPCSIDCDTALFITEGPFDALSIEACGGDAVATIGAGNHGYLEERMFRSGSRPLVFVCFDDDEAGNSGSGKLVSELEKIQGLTVMRYPVAGCCHDFNDMLRVSPAKARERVSLAKGLALSFQRGLLEKSRISKLVEAIRRHDGLGDGDEFVSRALSRLRRLWRTDKPSQSGDV